MIFIRSKIALATLALFVLAACAEPFEPLVSPEVSQTLRVERVVVNVTPEERRRFRLRDSDFIGNFQTNTKAVLSSAGESGAIPVSVVVDVDSASINPSGQSFASGEFSMNNLRNGQVISGPNEFTAYSGTSSGGIGGGLAGLLVEAAFKRVS